MVDLKAGVIALRANAAVLPGDTDKIISVGSSGGGQMSSALGATGNMEEYYPYLYEAGAIGVSFDAATGTYASAYDDSVYAAMAYCPIADIENADLAYAWLRYDSTVNADGSMSDTAGSYNFSAFQLALQEDAAYAFAAYINGLNLVDEAGNPLTFDENADGTLNPRSGSYYDVSLQNISDALNATLAAQEDAAAYLAEKYGTDTSAWLAQNADGSYQVTDLAAFIEATGLVRNKDIPGFDALNLSAENDAFGAADTQAVLEIEAQYRRFQQLVGQEPGYFEAHAVASPNLYKALALVAERYHLKFNDMAPMDPEGFFDGKPVAPCKMGSMAPEYDPFLCLQQAVAAAKQDRPNVFVCHPGYLDAYILRTSSLTVNRTKEVEMLCDPAVRDWLQQHDVQLLSYDEV